jgi:hypothetical protein
MDALAESTAGSLRRQEETEQRLVRMVEAPAASSPAAKGAPRELETEFERRRASRIVAVTLLFGAACLFRCAIETPWIGPGGGDAELYFGLGEFVGRRLGEDERDQRRVVDACDSRSVCRLWRDDPVGGEVGRRDAGECGERGDPGDDGGLCDDVDRRVCGDGDAGEPGFGVAADGRGDRQVVSGR